MCSLRPEDLLGLVLSIAVGVTVVGCGDDSAGGSGTGGDGGRGGAAAGSGGGGDGGSGAAGSGGMGGSPDDCDVTMSDGVLTNLDSVEFFGNAGSSVEITTANFFILERDSGTTLFVYGEVQNQGSSLECSLFLDLTLDGTLTPSSLVTAPAYENPFPGSSNWCLSPGEVGAFQAIENGVPLDLLENLRTVDYEVDAQTFGDEMPHSAAPTLVSSEIEFSEDQEPFVSGVLRTNASTQIFNLNLEFYLRDSCGLVVGDVGGLVGSPLTNVEIDFSTPPAITMQGTDVVDFLFFQRFSTN
ncbi:MAG: hypothetical protein AAGF92_01940 [Myxococcota bacterium]